MPRSPSFFSRTAFILATVLTLASCGGGSISAGLGGSGIGGTGITTVSGNVTQVVSRAPELHAPTIIYKLFAAFSKLLGDTANAQTGTLAGIQVSGGGKQAITDGNGRFDLEDVEPSEDFVLVFTPPNSKTASLTIGPVPVGSHVRVNNIVLNTTQGSAAADDIEIEKSDQSNESDETDDGDSTENENGEDGNAVDDDSTETEDPEEEDKEDATGEKEEDDDSTDS